MTKFTYLSNIIPLHLEKHSNNLNLIKNYKNSKKKKFLYIHYYKNFTTFKN